MPVGGPGGGLNDIPPLQALYMAAANQPQQPITVSANHEEEEIDETIELTGKDCYGNERLALADLAKFYNNQLLSDIQLRVGFNVYYAHKLILVRASEVFERMFSSQWTDATKVVSILHRLTMQILG